MDMTWYKTTMPPALAGLYPKAPPTMRQRILHALQSGPAHGQGDLLRQLSIGAGGELDHFNRALRIAISDGEVVELKKQLPGTGHEGPPVFEYTYTIAPGVRP